MSDVYKRQIHLKPRSEQGDVGVREGRVAGHVVPVVVLMPGPHQGFEGPDRHDEDTVARLAPLRRAIAHVGVPALAWPLADATTSSMAATTRR